MKSRTFKCAETQEHVNKVNMTVQEVVDILPFYELGSVPTTWTPEKIREACGDGKDASVNHDVAHMLLDDLVVAWKTGNEVLNDPMFANIMIELEKKQEECKHGHKHD